ncbi:hypothetical protein JRO89_XS06G0213100 [Xanthoceras sorbifolium]|uniref:Uncharacterized protein n=1 Tax=Xanthoceras sorbifolium TaxID=99658 RepID=A0ABQ8HZJ8_9ROSI|nr:hypothetical protein JRO89_XS06G0213100 [Xanthoceras sorbifolium]
MLSLQPIHLVSCKPCPKIPKLNPLRQVEFGSLWRNQAKNGCLIARSSVNISGGGDGGGSSFSLHPNTEKIQVGEPEPQNSQSNHENLGDPKIQLLSNQLKALQVELRKNNEEIKMLRETVQHSWKHLSTAVHAASSIQQVAQLLLDKTRNEPQQLKDPNTDENEPSPGKHSKRKREPDSPSQNKKQNTGNRSVLNITNPARDYPDY